MEIEIGGEDIKLNMVFVRELTIFPVILNYLRANKNLKQQPRMAVFVIDHPIYQASTTCDYSVHVAETLREFDDKDLLPVMMNLVAVD